MEAERRQGKTPLLKQTEIEVVEEDNGTIEEETSSGDTNVSNTTANSSFLPKSDSGATTPEQCSPNKQPANGSTDNLAEEEDCASSPPPPSQPLPQQQTETSPSQESPHQEAASSGRPHITSGVSLSKQKPLLRGTAICENASPPPPPVPEVKVTVTTPAQEEEDECVGATPILGHSRDTALARSHLQKNGSQSSDAGTTSSLSRESSIEKSLYKDSTGVDLEEFIKKTLFKSLKDRKMLLQIERDFKQFVEHDGDQYLQLAEMSSYDRMLVHRVAAFYGLDHNINQTGKCVIVSKTKYTRVPEFGFEEYLKSNPDSEPKRKIILKPKPHSFEERGSPHKNSFAGHRTKSLEERQKSYDEKRKQIFGSASQDETSPTLASLEPAPKPSLNSREQWSSTDSSGYGTEDSARRSRGLITKSNSYGGKPTIHLTPANPRTCSLSKADSIQSGSYESPPVRPNKLPTQSPENSQSPLSRSSSSEARHSPSQVQPHINPDGTVYRYDPNGPPPPFLATPTTPGTPSQPAISGTLTFGTSVQYQDPSDMQMCNVFSRMTVDGGMEGGTHVLTLPHPQLQPPQPAHQQHQPHGQHPLMVSTSLTPNVSQSPQQFISTYAQYPGLPNPYYSNPQVVQGAPVRYVITAGPPGHTTPVDSQGQPVPYGGTGVTVPASVYSTHPQTFSFVPGSALQPGLTDQVSMGPGTGYGQTVFTGPVGDHSANGSPYIPYASASGMYTYTTYTASGNGSNGAQVAPGATFYGPPQSSSPQLSFTGFSPGHTGQAALRPATPPSQMHPALPMNIAQPVGTYHTQQPASGGIGMSHPSHRVSSPPQFNPYMGTIYAPASHFPGQVRPVGQVVQVPMGPPTSSATVSVSNQHHHQTTHVPPLQHSQSFPVIRANPGGGTSPATNHIAVTPAANSNPTPPMAPPHHSVMVKSMSVGCIRPIGGAATPDKDPSGMMGGAAFMPGINQATAVPFSTQFIAPGIRQPGDYRMMGTAGIRPQLQTLPLTFTHQTGQPVKNRSSGPRQQRGSKRSNPRSASTADGQSVTTASASVARVISADASMAQPAVIRQ